MGIKNFRRLFCAAVMALVVAVDFAVAIPKTVTVYIDDSEDIKSSSYKTCAMTVGQFFEANDIEYDEGAEINCRSDDRISDNMAVRIALPVDISVIYDGKTIACRTTARTAGAVIKENDIDVDEDDILIPAASEKIRAGDEITVKRVDVRWEKSEEKIPYDIVTRPGYNVPIGRNEMVQEGQSGIRESTFRVTYIDGKEYSREKTKTETTKEPKNQITEYGLMINMAVPENLSYSRVYKNCRAVSYNYGETRYTASGRKCEYGVAAVDTDVFPFGTRLYIAGYGYAVAADRGTAITGTTVDLYFDHRIQCMTWGAQTVDIYVLR